MILTPRTPPNAPRARACAGRKTASGIFLRTRENRARKTCVKPLKPRQVAQAATTKSASGVCYYGFRYYNPQTGRWLSKDPLAERGGVNLYGMIGNNAVNEVDYLGLQSVYFFPPTAGLDQRLKTIFEKYKSDVKCMDCDGLAKLMAHAGIRIQKARDDLRSANVHFDRASTYNNLSLAQSVGTTVFGVASVTRSIVTSGAKASVTAIPAARGSIPLQGAIPLKHGGGIVGVGTGNISSANASLATARYSNYAYTGSGILLKDGSQELAQDFIEDAIDAAKAGLDTFGFLADEEIALGDIKSRGAEQRFISALAELKTLVNARIARGCE